MERERTYLTDWKSLLRRFIHSVAATRGHRYSLFMENCKSRIYYYPALIVSLRLLQFTLILSRSIIRSTSRSQSLKKSIARKIPFRKRNSINQNWNNRIFLSLVASYVSTSIINETECLFSYRFFIPFLEKKKEKRRVEKRVWWRECPNVHHLAHVISVVDSSRGHISRVWSATIRAMQLSPGKDRACSTCPMIWWTCSPCLVLRDRIPLAIRGHLSLLDEAHLVRLIILFTILLELLFYEYISKKITSYFFLISIGIK